MSIRSQNIRAERLTDAPLIDVDTDPALGGNVNGPSLIRAPEAGQPLGRYYLYFAHHQGTTIRLAYADHLLGPWTIHPPGALSLQNSFFPTEVPGTYAHIASPDVHRTNGEVRLYYHGMMPDKSQRTRVATSADGLAFTPRPEILGVSYFRVFAHGDAWYALGMPGIVYRSHDGLSGFEPIARCFNPSMRHAALLQRDEVLHVFWTQVGDAPERILHTAIDLGDWGEGETTEILRPERPWEGAGLPLEPSVRGADMAPKNQLRDPAVFEEDGRVYLLYSTAAEQGIALAELHGF